MGKGREEKRRGEEEGEGRRRREGKGASISEILNTPLNYGSDRHRSEITTKQRSLVAF